MGKKTINLTGIPNQPIEEVLLGLLLKLLNGVGVKSTFDLLQFVLVDGDSVPDPSMIRILKVNGCYNMLAVWRFYLVNKDDPRFRRDLHAKIGAILKGFGLPIADSDPVIAIESRPAAM